jgi:hypothetical protein
MPMRVFRKNFAAYIEMSPEDIGTIDRMIAAIQNMLNVSRWDAISTMFLWGFEVAAAKLESEELRSQAERVLVSRQYADELDRRRRHNKRIFAGVKELGYDGALQVAVEAGLDLDVVKELIEEAKPKGDNLTVMDRMSLWLSTVLGDRMEHTVEEIREMAAHDEILPDEESEEYTRAWDMLKKTASQAGYCGGKRGTWQMGMRARALDD